MERWVDGWVVDKDGRKEKRVEGREGGIVGLYWTFAKSYTF